jgi:hypothetical protein
MAVRITEALKGQLDALTEALQAERPDLAKIKGWERLVSDFAEWKALGDQGINDSFAFGKDGPYLAPKLEGNKRLQHVHLPPMSDHDDLVRWNKAYYWRKKNPRPKVSDRVLVYCQDGDDYLLIYILGEPDAHDIAKMTTPEDEATMRGFARVAEAFIQSRDVIA